MSALSKYILIFLIGGIIFFVFAIYYLGSQKNPKKTIEPLNLINNHSITNDSPLDYRNPAIIAPSINYTIRGRITKIISTDNNKEIYIDAPIKNLPHLIIHPGTVFKTIASGPTLVSSNELKSDQEVSLELLYNLRNKNWFVRDVYIINSTIPAPTDLSPTNASFSAQ